MNTGKLFFDKETDMKKIGFIDYYLDEWHANNYPEFFEKAAGEEMKVCCAWGKIDSPIGGMTNKQWSEKYNIELVETQEELIEKSDYIIVLSPDNPEMHVELSELALKSGKPVYIDKTFDLTIKGAKTIFKNSDDHATPCYSSSALYFSNELAKVKKDGITRIASMGGGKFEIYAIHQIEQIVALMGYDAKRVMYLGNCIQPSLLIEFTGGRFAEINHFNEQPFSMTVGYADGSSDSFCVESDFFGNCIKSMAEFFKTGIIPVSHEQTLAVVSVIEAGLKAKEKPFEWIEILT